MRTPILPVNEVHDLDAQVYIFWQNFEPREGGQKYAPLAVKVGYWDTRNMRHETTYDLLVVQLTNPVIGLDRILAPGVLLSTRQTTSTPAWRLRLASRVEQAKHSLLGKFKGFTSRRNDQKKK
jgi:hypothetical protein